MKYRHFLKSFFALIIISTLLFGCKIHKHTTENGDNSTNITAQDYLKKGNEQLDLKNYKEAITELNKSIELDAENGEAYAYRGMAKYNLKDYKKAITDFDIALKFLPDYGEVYDLRGVCKGELGDKTGACEDWNKAFDLGFNKAYDLIEKFCAEDKKQ